MRSLRLLLLCGIAVASLSVRAGNRTLQTPTRATAGNTTPMTSIFAADFTADGKPDVLVSETGKIRVLPGLGSGRFGAPIVTECASYIPEGFANLNGDGWPDLYLIGDAGTISVMFGAGNGSFTAPAAIPSEVSAGELVAGDFTGDGLPDLGVVSVGQIVIFSGDGIGGFPTSQTSPVVFYQDLTDATSGDFDDDGKLDIAFATESFAIVAWNNGTSFTKEDLPEYSQGADAEAADVNGDGISDLIISGNDGTYVSFGKTARGLTAVTFPDASYGGTYGDTIVTVADDDDGRADAVIGGAGGIKVLTHDGVAFRAPRTFATGLFVSAVAAADFTGDGKIDVVTAHDIMGQAPRDFFSMIPGNGDGTLRADIAVNISAAMGDKGFGQQAFVADVNGDGELDLVAVTYLRSDVAVMLGHGDGTFDAPVFTPLPDTDNGWGWVYDASDLNGDGRRDLILWDPGTIIADISFRVLFSQPGGTFTAGAIQTTPNDSGTATRLLPILDYTGDGLADLLAQSGNLNPGLGNGVFGPPIDTGIDSWAATTTIADTNGDSLPDLFVRGPSLSMYLNESEGTFAAPLTLPGYQIQCMPDMNGDGFADIVTYGVVYGDGAGGFVGSNFFIDARSQCAAADVDGDGKADVLAGNAIFFGAGDGKFDAVAQTAYGTPNSLSSPVVSTDDIDGNGSPDMWLLSGGLLTIVPTRTGDVGVAAPVVAVSTSPNPSSFPIPYQAQAVITGGNVKPRGAVLFAHGSEPPSALYCVLDNGSATGPHGSFPTDSTNTITATFLGDEYYAPSSASSSHTVQRGPTTVTVKTKSTYQIGETVIITASLKGNYGGSPTGTITYKNGDTVIGTLPASAGQGRTYDDPAIFPVGTHTVSTEYSGDANYLPSVSAPKTITITKVVPTMTLTLPAPPYTSQAQVTLTAQFPNHADVSGSVTFSCFGQTLGSSAIANAQASLLTNLPWGQGSCTAAYAGNDQYNPSSASQSLTVYYGSMPSAPLVTAHAGAQGWVGVAISPISGAATYDIYRGLDGAPMTLRTSIPSVDYMDFEVPAGTIVAVYAALARSGTGTVTPMGPRDPATFVTFTDDPLIASTTNIKATHITELQNTINAVRNAAGLTSTTFAAPAGAISAAHLTNLRVALTQARSALGLATPLTDPTITPGVTRVRAFHLQELRDAVK